MPEPTIAERLKAAAKAAKEHLKEVPSDFTVGVKKLGQTFAEVPEDFKLGVDRLRKPWRQPKLEPTEADWNEGNHGPRMAPEAVPVPYSKPAMPWYRNEGEQPGEASSRPMPWQTRDSVQSNAFDGPDHQDPFPGATKWSQGVGESIKARYPVLSEEGQRAGKAIENLRSKAEGFVDQPRGNLAMDEANDRVKGPEAFAAGAFETKPVQYVQGKVGPVMKAAVAKDAKAQEEEDNLKRMRIVIDRLKYAGTQADLENQRARVAQLTSGN